MSWACTGHGVSVRLTSIPQSVVVFIAIPVRSWSRFDLRLSPLQRIDFNGDQPIDVLMRGLLAVDDARDFAAFVAASTDDGPHANPAGDDALNAILGRDGEIPPFLVDRAATD